MEAYFQWMQLNNFSKFTLERRRYTLQRLINWCEDRSLYHSTEITKPILDRYRLYLFNFRKPDGRPLAFNSQHTMLCELRAFFRWLAQENLILYNPASGLELPKLGYRLPRDILSAREVEMVLNKPDVKTAIGIRDRAILETLYSTAMRAGEISRMELSHLDSERGTVFILQGKGKKDRLVPIGNRALRWIDKYLEDIRPDFLKQLYEPAVFLSSFGNPLTSQGMSAITSQYVNAAGFKGSCHVFRHTCATLMLERGADVRYVQQLLGHGNLSTTETYTHVSIRKLKQIHSATHPAKLERLSKP